MDALSRVGIPSRLRGFWVLAFATLALVSGLAKAEDQLPPGFTTVKPEPGRYQIVASALVRADTFLLDTWTGRVWQIVIDKAGSPLWQEMYKENLK
jgi:hypothetical protein